MATAKTAPPPPDTDDEPVTLDKVREVIGEVVGATLGKLFDSGQADVVELGVPADDDPLDKPLTQRDLEAFAAKQMRGQQDKIKPAPKPSAPPKDKSKDPPPDPHVEQGPEAKPGWRERLWS